MIFMLAFIGLFLYILPTNLIIQEEEKYAYIKEAHYKEPDCYSLC